MPPLNRLARQERVRKERKKGGGSGDSASAAPAARGVARVGTRGAELEAPSLRVLGKRVRELERKSDAKEDEEDEPPKKRGPGRPRKLPRLDKDSDTEPEEKPQKRGPGRPRKLPKAQLEEDTPDEKEEEEEEEDDAQKKHPLKRGPGRPRQHVEPDTEDNAETEGHPVQKRGRGRPRKHSLPGTTNEHVEDGESAKKRGAGRPRKQAVPAADSEEDEEDEQPPVVHTRSPGRPRKHPLPVAVEETQSKKQIVSKTKPKRRDSEEEDEEEQRTEPAKRKRGRPPKHAESVKDGASALQNGGSKAKKPAAGRKADAAEDSGAGTGLTDMSVTSDAPQSPVSLHRMRELEPLSSNCVDELLAQEAVQKAFTAVGNGIRRRVPAIDAVQYGKKAQRPQWTVKFEPVGVTQEVLFNALFAPTVESDADVVLYKYRLKVQNPRHVQELFGFQDAEQNDVPASDRVMISEVEQRKALMKACDDALGSEARLRAERSLKLAVEAREKELADLETALNPMRLSSATFLATGGLTSEQAELMPPVVLTWDSKSKLITCTATFRSVRSPIAIPDSRVREQLEHRRAVLIAANANLPLEVPPPRAASESKMNEEVSSSLATGTGKKVAGGGGKRGARPTRTRG